MICFKFRKSLRYYSIIYLISAFVLARWVAGVTNICFPLSPNCRESGPGNREVFLMESGIQNIFSHGIQNAGLWTPEHNSRNQEATDDWNPESSSWSAESTGVEFRIQDCLALPNMGGPLHNQEKKLWKLMKWSPKGKCFASFMATSLNQILSV